MKNKILQLLTLFVLLASCSEDFITKDEDKSRYAPNTFYTTKEHAIQALNAAYSGLNGWPNGYTWSIGIMHFVLGDDLYQTGYGENGFLVPASIGTPGMFPAGRFTGFATCSWAA